jgi:DNA polymerase-3 subunit delta
LKLPLRQLARHLERAPAPAYLIAGDEPLLVAQGVEQIRAAARRAGFTERELHIADRGFRWAEFEAGADNLSLFGARRIVELRLPSPKPGDAGAACIRALVDRPDPDRILIIAVGAKLDSAASRSVWVKTIERNGVLVEVWPVERGELPDWIRARGAGLGLQLSVDAAELLADRVEGNLLAADQELAKLAMTMPGAAIGEAEILEAVTDSARFDVFQLSDALIAGDAARSLRVLAGLRAEGVQPTLVCWAVSREIALLGRLQYAAQHGENIDNALARLGVWRRRQPALKQALRRLTGRSVAPLLAQAADVDATIKGIVRGQPWVALTGLVIAVTSRPGAASPVRH